MWQTLVVEEIKNVCFTQTREARRAASYTAATAVRTLPHPRMELRCLRVAQGSPREGRRPRQCTLRGPLSSCAMNSAAMLKTPGVTTAKSLSITLKTRRADMHAMMLAKKVRCRGIVMGLLLTYLDI